MSAYNYTPYKKSNKVISLGNAADTAARLYQQYATTPYTVGAGSTTTGNLYNNYYKDYQSLQKAKPSTQFKYGNQGMYDRTLKSIANRKAFSYDLADDQLFQTAKEQYQALGKTAMADTIGQASSMTGGYGNSYATSAGQLAYNNYLQQLNDSISDYYSMALSAYNAEGDRLNNAFGALSTDRTTGFNEWQGEQDVYNDRYAAITGNMHNALELDNSIYNQRGTNLYQNANLAENRYTDEYSGDRDTYNTQEKYKAEAASQKETEEQNLWDRYYKEKSLEETIRSNMADEAYQQDSLSETKRHNKETESASEAKSNNSTTKTSSIRKPKNAKSIIKNIKSVVDDDNRHHTKMSKEDIVTREIAKYSLTDAEKAYVYDQFGLL